jgi:uncharacterized protein YoxC
MEETTEENNSITINEVDYAVDSLSDKAKNLVSFIKKIDEDVTEHRFEMDKSLFARVKAIDALVEEMENPKEEEVEKVEA